MTSKPASSPAKNLSVAFFILLLALLGLNAVTPARASGVSGFLISKTKAYVQSSSAAPTPLSSDPFSFDIDVYANGTSNLLSTSTFTPPGGSPNYLLSNLGGLERFQAFISKSALDAAYPSGNYQFTVNTSAPQTYTGQIPLGADNYPALIPQIISLTNATWSGGNIVVTNVTKPVTITWNSFKTVGNSGSVELGVGDLYQFFPSDGTHNSFTFTPGTSTALANNELYSVDLRFKNTSVDATTFIPGASSRVGYGTRVLFSIVTGTGAISSHAYTVTKATVLRQISSSAPVGIPAINPLANFAPYDFEIQSPTAGSVVGPGPGSPYALTDTLPNYAYYSGSLTGLTGSSGLNTLYPDGTYTFKAANGGTLGSVALSGGVYPNVPQITGVNGNTPIWNAQGQLVLDPSIDNTITWSPFTASNTHFTFATGGLEIVSFTDNHNVDLGLSAGPLFNQSTTPFHALLIPAHTMTTANTYVGSITYALASATGAVGTSDTITAAYLTTNCFLAVASPPLGVSQTITFPAIANKNVGASFALNAKASSGLPITYTTAGGVTISGNTATVTSAGTISIRAHQNGNSTYLPAPSVLQTFTASQVAQTITFPVIPRQFVGAKVTLKATASSGLAVTYKVTSGATTLSGNVLTLTAAGSVSVTASQAGSAIYKAAASVPQSFVVSQKTQTITFPAIANKTYPSASFSTRATASSSLPITYTTTGPVKVSGNTLTLTGVGTVNIRAHQDGNAEYEAAPTVLHTFTVTAAP